VAAICNRFFFTSYDLLFMFRIEQALLLLMIRSGRILIALNP